MKVRKRSALAQKLGIVYTTLLETYGLQVCFLHHRNAFELLCAVILSAQCTDKTVNANTPELFKHFPDAKSLAAAEPETVEPFIRAIGLYRAKARYLVEMSRMLVSLYKGEVPGDLESLTRLPGVGRKTANVVLSDAFGVPGFAVDTHVKRLLNRLGVAAGDSPEELEAVVNAHVDPAHWGSLSHLLIVHGRTICQARKPDCVHCPLSKICAKKVK